MSQCCTSSNNAVTYPKKHSCPINGKVYSSVSSTTILHHIKEPWNWHKKEQGYYFCTDPECDVVYFSQDNSLIYKSELRTTVGIKEQSNNALVCYCFGVTKALSQSKMIKDFVVKSTQEKNCDCLIKNPSGKCCLKDFSV